MIMQGFGMIRRVDPCADLVHKQAVQICQDSFGERVFKLIHGNKPSLDSSRSALLASTTTSSILPSVCLVSSFIVFLSSSRNV
jgi:hypothetical protein